MVFPKAPPQHQTKLRPLAAEPTLGFIRQPIGMLLARDDRLDDAPSGGAQDIGGYRYLGGGAGAAGGWGGL
jgi:hypothetical protein